MAKELKNISPVSPDALTSFISFFIDRVGFINTADTLGYLMGLSEDDVRGIEDGTIKVYSHVNGGLILRDATQEEDAPKKFTSGTRENNTLERSRIVRELAEQGMSVNDISKSTGMCAATVRKYINNTAEDLVNRSKGKSVSQDDLRNMWVYEMLPSEKDDTQTSATIYAFKNGSCADAARRLEWGWIAPNGDIFGSMSEYNSYEMFHDRLADVIGEKEGIEKTREHNSFFHTLEALGWIKFEGGRVCGDLDISSKDNTYVSAAHLITEKQRDFIADYMEHQYIAHHTMPNVGFTPREFPITYLRVRSMDMEMFRKLITQ